MLELEKYEDDEDKNVKKKTGNQECSQGHSMEEDEMALQECNKLSDLLALFHNWFFVYMVEIKANKTTLYTSLFL